VKIKARKICLVSADQFQPPISSPLPTVPKLSPPKKRNIGEGASNTPKKSLLNFIKKSRGQYQTQDTYTGDRGFSKKIINQQRIYFF
jgi:hypothetical protein